MDFEMLMSALSAALSFALASSSIYCLNDIRDVEADRAHPVKRLRPIASGDVRPWMAVLWMVLLVILSGLVSMLTSDPLRVCMVVGCYWVINVAYCLRLKNIAIIDVFIVSTGFVLRILAGGVSTDILPTNWLVLMTFLLALFLAFAKRRDDVIRMNATGYAPRANTHRYNLEFMDQTLGITSSVTMVCYILFSVSPDVENRFHSSHLYLTSVFVLLGLLRYLQLAIVDKKTGDPTRVALRDRFIQLAMLAWLLSFVFIIYI